MLHTHSPVINFNHFSKPPFNVKMQIRIIYVNQISSTGTWQVEDKNS